MFFFNSSTLDDISYHNIADETLDAIAELFEDLGESPSSPTDYDVQLSVRLSLCPDPKLVFCNRSSIFALPYSNFYLLLLFHSEGWSTYR